MPGNVNYDADFSLNIFFGRKIETDGECIRRIAMLVPVFRYDRHLYAINPAKAGVSICQRERMPVLSR